MCLPLLAFACAAATPAWAEQPDPKPRAPYIEEAHPPARYWDQETLTYDWVRQGGRLEKAGIITTLDVMQVYQLPVGGTSSARFNDGRYTGKYKWRTLLDLDKLLHLPGATLKLRCEGGWSGGAYAGEQQSTMDMVNATAMGNETIALTKVRFQQKLLDGRVVIRLGKLDPGAGIPFHESYVAFDNNAYANDEDNEFLSQVFYNSPTTPFPSKGMGLIVLVEPVERVYCAFGMSDADASETTTGFNTAFHGPFNELYLFETGYAAAVDSPQGELVGAYRLGLWCEPRQDGPKGIGFYSSCDQKVFRESGEDDQGLGLFFRFGYSDGNIGLIRTFWSLGAVYKGLIPTRDKDTLGVAWGQGIIGKNASYPANMQNNLEVYYRFEVTPFLHVSPILQHVMDPGGGVIGKNVTVLGCRVHLSF